MFKRIFIIFLIFARIINVNAQFFGGEHYCNFSSSNHAQEVHSTLKKSDFIHFISNIEPEDSSWFELMERNDDLSEALYVWHRIEDSTISHSNNSYSKFKNEIELIKKKIVNDKFNLIYFPEEGGVNDFFIHHPFTIDYVERLKNEIIWKKVVSLDQWDGHENGWYQNECENFFLLGEPIIPSDSLTSLLQIGGCTGITEIQWNENYSKRQYPVLKNRAEDLFWFHGANVPKDFGIYWDQSYSLDSLGRDPYIAYFLIPNLEFGVWTLTGDQMCGESIPISYAQMEELDPNFSRHKEILEDLYFTPPIPAPPPPPATTETILNIVDEVNLDQVFSSQMVEKKPIFPGCEDIDHEYGEYLCFDVMIRKFVVKGFNYPEKARQMGIQGTIYISFIIEKDGNVSNVEIAPGVDNLLGDEAIRVVNSLPTMIPAKVAGEPVRVWHSLSLKASLQ